MTTQYVGDQRYRPNASREAKDRLRALLMEEQDGECAICGCIEWFMPTDDGPPGTGIGVSFDLHRIAPGKEGGRYQLGNVVLICQACHKAEHYEKCQPYLMPDGVPQ